MFDRVLDVLKHETAPSTLEVFVPKEGITQAYGLAVPAADTPGYAPGCTFKHTDASTPNTCLYVNRGTLSACDFRALLLADPPGHSAQAALNMTLSAVGSDTVDLSVIDANFTAIQNFCNQLRLDLISVQAIKGEA